MARQKRNWHPDYVKYTEEIISHPNYHDYPLERKKDGSIRWLAPAKTAAGKKRIDWFDKKRAEFGIAAKPGWISEVALAIHPTKQKPCQVCGRVLSLDYVYLNKRLVDKINKVPQIRGTFSDLSTLDELIATVTTIWEKEFIKILNFLFNTKMAADTPTGAARTHLAEIGALSKLLGPGAMSNAPDRLDGFHSYNRCCRATEDTGRHALNLQRYSDDRRAYENWVEGNWKAANRLMAEFSKHNVSADHIGPISLGFRHDPFFQPMSVLDQATKNNRMRKIDIDKLLERERSGHEVTTWHSKAIWDSLKVRISNDKQAVLASALLRENMHFVLSCLAYIHRNGGDAFLEYIIHPQLQYSFYDYTFDDFDPNSGSYKQMRSKKLEGKNQENNAKRYKRIAFEALEDYASKENRRFGDLISAEYLPDLKKVLDFAEEGKFAVARNALEIILDREAKYLTRKYLRLG